MKPKSYAVLEMAVEEGIFRAWRRAFKHAEETPSSSQRVAWEEATKIEVMNAICEWFEFGDSDAL